MTDLFVDLYRYRQRENKNNLEDWFTECLAAAFRSLDQSQWFSLLVTSIGLSEDEAELLLEPGLPTVETQVQAGSDYGIPDLVIYSGNAAAIVFENKVAHGVAEAEVEEGTRNQLHRYCEWLQKEAGDNGIKRLIFLTHLTRPPEDFGRTFAGDTCPYKMVDRRSQTWGELARHLLKITSDEGERALSYGLVSSLYNMLENENMANEFPGSTEFAALEVMLAQGGAIENLLKRMWSEVSGVGNSTKMSREVTDFEFEFGRYSVHRYVNRIPSPDTRYAFVMTGVWFPEVEAAWEAGDLGGYKARGPQIFLLFGDDHDDMFEEIEGKPGPDWHRPASDFLKLTPLYDFTGSPDERAAKILEWLASAARELRPFLVEKRLTD